MPRPVVLGNGRLLIGLDGRQTIRDLFFPRVGFPNHLNGYAIRMGVWAGGRFAWIDEDGWTRESAYEPETLVAASRLRHPGLGVSLEMREAVSPHHDRYVRQVVVRNETAAELDVRLFFNQDLRLNESDIGDTALYAPQLGGMLHYKGATALLFGGTGFYQYTAGYKGFNGHEGTGEDARDGELMMKPIEQGAVDSTFSLRTAVPAGGASALDSWIVAGASLKEVQRELDTLRQETVAGALDEASAFWRAWSDPPMRLVSCLPAEVQDLFRRSLLIMRTHFDDGGAVIAASDSDILKTNRATYCYAWPRDGAFVSLVMDRCGYPRLGRRFFEFCARVFDPERPVLAHKYNPDGTLGASWHPWIANGKPEIPFQEDESALTIHALWEHYRLHGDLELLGELYDPLVVPLCDFMAEYRDPKTGLPLPSWDLWEERRGVHTFTVASLVSAFRCASRIAEAVGNQRARQYATVAEELAHALGGLFDEGSGAFLRGLDSDGRPDATVDASTLAVGLLHALAPVDPRVRANVEAVERALAVPAAAGGVARYQGDYYFRQRDGYPGNPWIICTLWLAQARMLLAESAADLETPLAALKWAARHAAPTGALPEQVHPDSGEPLSVLPLVWSHAEFVNSCLELCERRRELGVGP